MATRAPLSRRYLMVGTEARMPEEEDEKERVRGRSCVLLTGVVSDLLAIEGDVEIAADENLLALELGRGQVLDRLLLGSRHGDAGGHATSLGNLDAMDGGSAPEAGGEGRRADSRLRRNQKCQ
eukprot:766188-Hanusia_phi.AAC.2